MAQDKRIFTGGMDKDSDPRLIKQGDYRHARNIRNIASSDGTSGSVENIEGTLEVVHNFIDEKTYEVSLMDNGALFEVPPREIFYEQEILFRGRELPGSKYDFQVKNYNQNGNLVDSNLSNLSWGYQETAAFLFNAFRKDFGTKSQNIQVIDVNNGDIFTAHSEIFTIGTNEPFNENTLVQETPGFGVRIIADQPNRDFNLDFVTQYSENPYLDLWSDTITTQNIEGELPIGNGVFIGSSASFNQDTEGNPLPGSEEGNPIADTSFGFNQFENEYVVVLEGSNPTDAASAFADTKVYSVAENLDSSVEVQQLFTFEKSQYASGGEFEFNGDKNEIAASLVKQLTNFEGVLLEPGNKQSQRHAIRSGKHIITGFNGLTKLENKRNRSVEQEPDSSFFLTEAYTLESDFIQLNTENTDISNFFNISNSEITISEGAKDGDRFKFPVRLRQGIHYRLQANISTFGSVGSTLIFEAGKSKSSKITGTNSSFKFNFILEDQTQNYFSLILDQDIAEGKSIVIKNVTISEFKEPNRELPIIIRHNRRFDLVFGTSEEQVRQDYPSKGQKAMDKDEFLPGINVSLRPINQTSWAMDSNFEEEFSLAQEQIENLKKEIKSLRINIENITANYNTTLSILNTALSLDSSEAIAQLDLTNNSVSEFQSIHNSITNSISNLISNQVPSFFKPSDVYIVSPLDANSSKTINVIGDGYVDLTVGDVLFTSDKQRIGIISGLRKTRRYREIAIILTSENEVALTVDDQIHISSVLDLENQPISNIDDLISQYNSIKDDVSQYTSAIDNVIVSLQGANLSDLTIQSDLDAKLELITLAVTQVTEISNTIGFTEVESEDGTITNTLTDLAGLSDQITTLNSDLSSINNTHQQIQGLFNDILANRPSETGSVIDPYPTLTNEADKPLSSADQATLLASYLESIIVYYQDYITSINSLVNDFSNVGAQIQSSQALTDLNVAINQLSQIESDLSNVTTTSVGINNLASDLNSLTLNGNWVLNGNYWDSEDQGSISIQDTITNQTNGKFILSFYSESSSPVFVSIKDTSGFLLADLQIYEISNNGFSYLEFNISELENTEDITVIITFSNTESSNYISRFGHLSVFKVPTDFVDDGTILNSLENISSLYTELLGLYGNLSNIDITDYPNQINALTSEQLANTTLSTDYDNLDNTLTTTQTSLSNLQDQIGTFLNAIDTLTSNADGFTIQELSDTLDNLTLNSLVDSNYIANYNTEHETEIQNLTIIIDQLQNQINALNLGSTTATPTVSVDEYDFSLYGINNFNYENYKSSFQNVKLVYRNIGENADETLNDWQHALNILIAGGDDSTSLAEFIYSSCHSFGTGDLPHFDGDIYEENNPHSHSKVLENDMGVLKLELKFSKTADINNNYLVDQFYGAGASQTFISQNAIASTFQDNDEDIIYGLLFTIRASFHVEGLEFGLEIDGDTSTTIDQNKITTLIDNSNTTTIATLFNSSLPTTQETIGGGFRYLKSTSGDYSLGSNLISAASSTFDSSSGWTLGNLGNAASNRLWTITDGKLRSQSNDTSTTNSVAINNIASFSLSLEPSATYEIHVRAFGKYYLKTGTQRRLSSFKIDLGSDDGKYTVDSEYNGIKSSNPFILKGLPNGLTSETYNAVVQNLDETAPNYTSNTIVITTHADYSQNVIRVIPESENPNKGFYGTIGDIQVFKRQTLVEQEGISSLKIRAHQSSVSTLRSRRSVVEAPEFAPSRVFKGAAKKIIKNAITGSKKIEAIVSLDYKCIGAYEDKPTDKVYYFIHNKDAQGRKYDCILEYDLLDDVISTVYQDDRPPSGKTNSNNNILNFDENQLITGINKIDDILYFTDDFNRPRKINVRLAKQNEFNIDNCRYRYQDIVYHKSTRSVYIGGDKEHPFKVGDNVYTQFDRQNSNAIIGYNGYSRVEGLVVEVKHKTLIEVTQGSTTIKTRDSEGELTSDHDLGASSIGKFIGIQEPADSFPRFFKIQAITGSSIELETPYDGNTLNSFPYANPLSFDGVTCAGIITDTPFFQSFSSTPGSMLYADPSSVPGEEEAYSPLISFGSYEEKSKYFDVIKHQPLSRPSCNAISDSSFATNNILDNLFQFKYRYIHKDEESTSYSGISDIVIDDEFALNSAVSAEDYSRLKNRIDVKYEDSICDVKSIEIVARKGNDGEFFLVDTVENNFIKHLKILKNDLIEESGNEYDNTESFIKFYNNGTYPFIDKSDSNKLFDAVPQLAKAQTILSNNRLAYGNVVEGYDNTTLVVKSEFENTGNQLTTQVTDLSSFSGTPGINWGNKNDNSIFRARLDLSGLSLSFNKNQSISLDITFFYRREVVLGQNQNRSGLLNAFYDVTGIADTDDLCENIVGRINNGDFSGGADQSQTQLSATNKSVTATYEGNGIILFTFKVIPENPPTGIFGDYLNSEFESKSKFTSGDSGVNSFKTGAFHSFGIAYFDETNRCSFVNTGTNYNINFDGSEINGTKPYNKFYTESSDVNLATPSRVNFRIYNKPPVWATHYQMYYSGNTTVDNDKVSDFSGFTQIIIPNTVLGDDSNDKQIYLSLAALKGQNFSYNQIYNSQIDYDYVDGDRIRFISFVKDGSRYTFNEYIDLEIAGVDLYAGDEEDPISETGWFLRINNPEKTNAGYGDADQTINIAHSGFSLTSSGYNKLIAEIYRPKKDINEDFTTYYEIGDKRPIINPGKDNRAHDGNSTQSSNFTFNSDFGVEVSSTPAEISLSGGDIYFKSRSMITNSTGSTSEIFFPEDYYLNDFHDTNHYNIGRINVINTNAKKRRLNASVYYSETYSSTGSINGLSSFNLANVPYFDYNKDFGSIQSLMNRADDLMIFHENKVGRVLVQKNIVNFADGDPNVTLSTNIISNYVQTYSGNYGCCLQPESIVKYNDTFYFVDIKRGAVLRLGGDGITIISDNGMRDYFRDIGEMYVINNPEESEISFENTNVLTQGGQVILTYQSRQPFSIVAGYDPKYDEYIVSFPNVLTDEGVSWNTTQSFWSSDTSLITSGGKSLIFKNKTIAFNERINRWTSFYDFNPDYYARVGRQFIGFVNGRLYKHNMTDRRFQSLYAQPEKNQNKYNYIYGNQKHSIIQFPFNGEPGSIKTYNALSLESDGKWFAYMYTNLGQTITGNQMPLGYNNTINTKIEFKRVDGEINNYQDEDGQEVLLTGVNTTFFKDLRKGDLVKIHGHRTEEGSRVYSYNYNVVKEVVSNTILKLNSYVNRTLDNSYMEVIDYKTKEGIHYSKIPFVSSDVDVSDSYNMESANYGDGSEIEGAGPVSKATVGGSNSKFTGTFNIVSVNARVVTNTLKVGGQYVVKNLIASDQNFNLSSVSDVYSDAGFGTVFVCRELPPSEFLNQIYIYTTECKLYLQKPDGTTLFIGYPTSSSLTSIDFIPREGLINDNVVVAEEFQNGFLFVVKNGKIEGERMKGQYMMTTLSTMPYESFNPYFSRNKFNLYAANVDVDKSELSGNR